MTLDTGCPRRPGQPLLPVQTRGGTCSAEPRRRLIAGGRDEGSQCPEMLLVLSPVAVGGRKSWEVASEKDYLAKSQV